MALKPFFQRIYFGDILIPAVERKQDVSDTVLEKLKEYRQRTEDYISDKNKTLTNAQNFYDGREMVIKVKVKNHQKVKIKCLILVFLNKLLN